MISKILYTVLIVFLAALPVACSGETVTPQVKVTVSATPTFSTTDTPTPTWTLEPTPTFTPQPTSTPVPTKTPEPSPTAIFTPVPKETAKPGLLDRAPDFEGVTKEKIDEHTVEYGNGMIYREWGEGENQRGIGVLASVAENLYSDNQLIPVNLRSLQWGDDVGWKVKKGMLGLRLPSHAVLLSPLSDPGVDVVVFYGESATGVFACISNEVPVDNGEENKMSIYLGLGFVGLSGLGSGEYSRIVDVGYGTPILTGVVNDLDSVKYMGDGCGVVFSPQNGQEGWGIGNLLTFDDVTAFLLPD